MDPEPKLAAPLSRPLADATPTVPSIALYMSGVPNRIQLGQKLANLEMLVNRPINYPIFFTKGHKQREIKSTPNLK